MFTEAGSSQVSATCNQELTDNTDIKIKYSYKCVKIVLCPFYDYKIPVMFLLYHQVKKKSLFSNFQLNRHMTYRKVLCAK